MDLLIVTGMSGSGKSAVTDALEDLGYFCADNMPPALIPTIAQFINTSHDSDQKVATVTDIRVGESALRDFKNTFETLEKMNYKYKILFIDAADDVIINRYNLTRRKHPLLEKCEGSLSMSLAYEREIMRDIRAIADYTIDTSKTTVAECKQRVIDLFLENPGSALKISCMSFGFKYGIPADADLVFDVRCLPNPFYIPELKYHTGLEKEVCDFVMKFEQSQILLKKLDDLIEYLVPLYRKEGKSQLIIAIGCTGGRHRSVCFAEQIKDKLSKAGNSVSIKHRDIEK
jgi:UPF0042 nucleotide-binding protein